MNAQTRREWLPLFTDHMKGKTVLIVGVGHLGGAGAQQAKRCGLHVIGVRRSGRPHRACHQVVGQDALHTVLPDADFVVVTVPSTSATDGMIGEREFRVMKKTAGLLNFSRAQTVDYDALVRKLRRNELSGAILDVFDPEPLPSESDLWEAPNLLITPHCSSDDLLPVHSDDTRSCSRQCCAGDRRPQAAQPRRYSSRVLTVPAAGPQARIPSRPLRS